MQLKDACTAPTATGPSDDLRVISLDAFAKSADISASTLRRLLKDGRGPAVVKLSTRRVGIRVAEGLRWLKSREVA